MSCLSLGGLDLATNVIKRAAEEIKNTYPSIRYFSTLSPIPGLLSWLREELFRAAQVQVYENYEDLHSVRRQYENTTDTGHHLLNLLSSHYESLRLVHPTNEVDPKKLLEWLLEVLSDPTTPLWTLDEKLAHGIKAPLVYLTAVYLVYAKNGGRSGNSQIPRDPVARFPP